MGFENSIHDITGPSSLNSVSSGLNSVSSNILERPLPPPFEIRRPFNDISHSGLLQDSMFKSEKQGDSLVVPNRTTQDSSPTDSNASSISIHDGYSENHQSLKNTPRQRKEKPEPTVYKRWTVPMTNHLSRLLIKHKKHRIEATNSFTNVGFRLIQEELKAIFPNQWNMNKFQIKKLREKLKQMNNEVQGFYKLLINENSVLWSISEGKLYVGSIPKVEDLKRKAVGGCYQGISWNSIRRYINGNCHYVYLHSILFYIDEDPRIRCSELFTNFSLRKAFHPAGCDEILKLVESSADSSSALDADAGSENDDVNVENISVFDADSLDSFFGASPRSKPPSATMPNPNVVSTGPNAAVSAPNSTATSSANSSATSTSASSAPSDPSSANSSSTSHSTPASTAPPSLSGPGGQNENSFPPFAAPVSNQFGNFDGFMQMSYPRSQMVNSRPLPAPISAPTSNSLNKLARVNDLPENNAISRHSSSSNSMKTPSISSLIQNNYEDTNQSVGPTDPVEHEAAKTTENHQKDRMGDKSSNEKADKDSFASGSMPYFPGFDANSYIKLRNSIQRGSSVSSGTRRSLAFLDQLWNFNPGSFMLPTPTEIFPGGSFSLMNPVFGPSVPAQNMANALDSSAPTSNNIVSGTINANPVTTAEVSGAQKSSSAPSNGQTENAQTPAGLRNGGSPQVLGPNGSPTGLSNSGSPPQHINGIPFDVIAYNNSNHVNNLVLMLATRRKYLDQANEVLRNLRSLSIINAKQFISLGDILSSNECFLQYIISEQVTVEEKINFVKDFINE